MATVEQPRRHAAPVSENGDSAIRPNGDAGIPVENHATGKIVATVPTRS